MFFPLLAAFFAICQAAIPFHNDHYYLYEAPPDVVPKKNVQKTRYEPNWDSIDSRPLPDWFDKAKIGIFIHWGVFSVPSFGGDEGSRAAEWFWSYWKANSTKQVEFMEKNYPPSFKYQEFAKDFTAQLYDPDQWAELFAKSGAKYVVLTSKHHEGYTLWPSEYSFGWNAQDVGPGRDILGDLAEAVRKQNLTFGVYHSLFEWYNPMYLADKEVLFLKNNFAKNKIIPEMKELINNYKPAVLWSDGDWEAPDAYWNSTEFLAWLYNDSPVSDVVVTNDRWGMGIPCNHGGFFSCADRYNPGTLQPRKWENAMTIDRDSWGFRRNADLSSYLSIHELIETLTQTIACGGNILINVGPTKDGIIAPIYEERLTQLGEWLDINGEAIYESVPWTSQNDTLTPGVWYTLKDDDVYATVLNWPEANKLTLKSVYNLLGDNSKVVQLLGNAEENLDVTADDEQMTVTISFPDRATVRSETAWVLKITSA